MNHRTPAIAPPGRTDDTLGALRRGGLAFADLVEALPSGGWTRPTPCPGWDVSRLVAHTASILENLVPMAAGNRLPPAIDPAELGSAAHTAGRVRSALLRGVAVWDRRALTTVRRFPWGVTSGRRAVDFTLVEVVGHGWDLARASGRALDLDDDDVWRTATIVERHLGWARLPGLFEPPVEVHGGAAPLDRLAALLGRKP